MRFAKVENKKVDAYSYNYRELDKLVCPCCKQQVIYCKGEVIRPYFRHSSLHNCPYSLYDKDRDNQSEIHILIKDFLHKMLERDNPNARVSEQQIITDGQTKRIADVYAEYQYKDKVYKYAFEIQKSPKSKKSIYQKNQFYKKCGVIPVWILDENLSSIDKRLTAYTFKAGDKFHHGYLCYVDYRNVINMTPVSRNVDFDIEVVDYERFFDIGYVDNYFEVYPISNFRLYGNKIFNYSIRVYVDSLQSKK